MAKSPGRCIFCGSYGLSKEHVFPNWLRAIFPRLPTDTHTFGTLDWNSLQQNGRPLSHRIRKQGHAGSIKVKVVCKTCNNGWLSRMEQSVKPLIEKMVLGTEGKITQCQQRQLVAWLTKTTMTAEFIKPTEVAISQTEREEFKSAQSPNSHWQIWIAYYIGTKQLAGGIFHHGIGIYPPPLPIRAGVKNTQFTVFGLGRMMAITLSSEQGGLTFHLHQEAEIAVKRLWPVTGVDLTWPPARGIDDAAADRIVASFGTALGLPLSLI